MVLAKALLTALAATGALAANLPSLEIKGAKFFYPNGTQFIIRGVAYQQDSSAGGTVATNATFIDSLVSESNCKRDIPYLQKLNTNLIRTYGVDPKGDHDACMQMLSDAGIYVIADLGNPSFSINRADPQWNVELYDYFKSITDTMSKYSNVAGFFVGNEVTNNATTTNASAYVKAAVRDMKAYVKSQNYKFAIGYAADDASDLRNVIADYMNCGDESTAVDFYGYNVYEWCGDSNFQKSGYNRIIDFFETYSVPAFFAEYGCDQVPGGAAGRKWTEATAMYADNMTAALSGGIAYEYFQETNNYGLVNVSSDGTITELADFAPFEKAINNVDPKGVEMSSYNPSNKARDCPAVNSTWQSNAESLPPTPNDNACECAANASTCVPVSNLASTDYGAIFNYVCGQGDACDSINANTSTGKYGVYSMCSDQQKLAIVLGAYHAKNSGGSSNSCSFNGNATTQKGSGNTSCASLAPSGGSNGGSGGSSNSSSGDDNKSLGAMVGPAGFGAAASVASVVALVAGAMMAM